MVLLLAIVALRSVAWFGLITFVPLWEVSLGHSKSYGAHLLSLMLLDRARSGRCSPARRADRFGRRPVLMASNVVVPPAILVFVLVGGVPGAIALCVVGPAVVGTFGVTMVMSQEYLPRHIGMASGLVDRPVDRARRDRGRDPRRRRRLGRPARRRSTSARPRPSLGAALTALLPSSRARHAARARDRPVVR